MKNIILVFLVFVTLTTNAQIGIGTSSPNASAKLEIASTSKGFLPPRMTLAQRDAIIGPATGLVLWCTNCGNNGELQVYNGTQWTNMIGGAAASTPLVIGQSTLGGTVAYILQSGDPGYNASTQHGFIIPSNYRTSSSRVTSEWGCAGVALSGADATGIGYGNQNTLDIVAACTTTGIAAKHCADLVTGGYSDWYLPSKDELWKVFQNRAANGITSLDAFWSSSEINSNDVWVVEFNGQVLQSVWKGYTNYSILPIRAF